MILLGLILLIAGWLLGIHLLVVLGLILVVVGVILLVLGSAGHQLGPRRHYW